MMMVTMRMNNNNNNNNHHHHRRALVRAQTSANAAHTAKHCILHYFMELNTKFLHFYSTKIPIEIRTCTKIKRLDARHRPHPCKIKKFIITVRRQLTFGVISKIPIQFPLHPETKDIAKIN